MHEKHQKRLFWAIVISESSHIFCCVLPTVISLISLLTAFGIVIAVPDWMNGLHDFMHRWELTMIVVSVIAVALGWALYFYNKRAECCHHTGCHHAPCGPRKRAANKILIVASVLMVFNLGMYFGVHRPMDAAALDGAHHDHSSEEMNSN